MHYQDNICCTNFVGHESIALASPELWRATVGPFLAQRLAR